MESFLMAKVSILDRFNIGVSWKVVKTETISILDGAHYIVPGIYAIGKWIRKHFQLVSDCHVVLHVCAVSSQVKYHRHFNNFNT